MALADHIAMHWQRLTRRAELSVGDQAAGASGNTRAEAVAHALAELIERDTISALTGGRGRSRLIDPGRLWLLPWVPRPTRAAKSSERSAGAGQRVKASRTP
jgi:hypothetical protein